jgi:hypothetical protein
MGQVTLARVAKDHLRDAGSITLATGILAMRPITRKYGRNAGSKQPIVVHYTEHLPPDRTSE